MNLWKIAVLSMVLGNTYAVAECAKPDAPTLPNGATSAMEDMLAGQKAVKAFQAANIEYMGCLEAAFNAAEKTAQSSKGDEKTAAQATYDESIDAYNAAVSQEEEVAGQFNTEIRDYKAANAK